MITLTDMARMATVGPADPRNLGAAPRPYAVMGFIVAEDRIVGPYYDQHLAHDGCRLEPRRGLTALRTVSGVLQLGCQCSRQSASLCSCADTIANGEPL